MIPWDEGVTKRSVATPHGDVDVWMRKSQPGLYFDGAGEPVSEELARKAGFPVDEHQTERRVSEHLKDQEREIRRRLAVEEYRVRGFADPPFREHHNGGGNYAVRDSSGKSVTQRVKLNREEAMQLAHRLCETLYHRRAGYSKDEIATILGPAPAIQKSDDAPDGDADLEETAETEGDASS